MRRIGLRTLLLIPIVFFGTHILMEHMVGGKTERGCVYSLKSPYICLKSNFIGQIFPRKLLNSCEIQIQPLEADSRLPVWELSEEELEKICSQRELLCCERREFLTKCSSSTYKVFQQLADLGFSQQCYDGNQRNLLAFTPGGAK